MSNLDLELSNQDRKLLLQALIKCSSPFDEFRSFLIAATGDPLRAIAENLAPSSGALAALAWIEANGHVRSVTEALEQDPDKVRLPAVAAYLDAIRGMRIAAKPAPLPSAQYEDFGAKAQWAGQKSAGLEAMIQTDNELVLADQWSDAMKLAQSRVCKIEAPAGRPVGTGFLVGAQLILTNCHVYRLLEGKPAIAVFDNFRPGDKGVCCPIESNRLAVSTEDRLDFAMLRLGTAPDPSRGAFAPKDHRFEIGQVQLILQHAMGSPLQLGIGHVSAVQSQPGLPARVFYTTNTEPGSSGSPVFTMNWELVAIHHYGDPRNNVGVPIAPIWKALAQQGLL